MHEISICRSILDIVNAQAESQNYRKVKRVRLEVGPLSGVEIEAVARCLCCDLESHIKQRFDACPHCGSHRLKITAGEELRIKELEVE